MGVPDAVLKHDGRRVAFDAGRLAASVANAARGSMPAAHAERLAREAAAAIGAAALEHGRSVVATSDLRELCVRTLREMTHDAVADAYQIYARDMLAHAQRLRVAQPEASDTHTSGSTWDRRRLIDSMRVSRIAFDLAGATARAVERRVLALQLETVSPALVHALVMLTLPTGALGARAYAIRRVAYSAAHHFPHFNASVESHEPLPASGAALEAFWLQGVHSAAVLEAVRDNLISLDPCPSNAGQSSGELDGPSPDDLLDPLANDFWETLHTGAIAIGSDLSVQANSVERVRAVADVLARASLQPGIARADGARLENAALLLYFKTTPAQFLDAAHRASPVTINAGGLVAREAIRDPRQAASRLIALAQLATTVHREREEYFRLSAARGRVLPIAVAGLWNAMAWLQGEGFDATRAAIGAHQVIAPLCQALKREVTTLCAETGMELVLTAAAPLRAEQRLWHADRGFFLNDGLKLNTASAYESGPELRVAASMRDFTNRLDFAKAIAQAFDEPSAVTVEAALTPDIDAHQWKEFLDAFARAGISSLRVTFRGSARAVPNLTRAIRSYSIGFPLLDALTDAHGAVLSK